METRDTAQRESRFFLQERFFVLRMTLIAIVICTFTVLTRHIVLDDGLIYARFLSHALNGQGLVFNVGEHVNALTSPLFTYLLLGVSWLLKGRVLIAEHLLFAVTFFGASLLAERMVPLSGLLISSTAYFYILIGLETTTFLLLLMLTARAYADKRYNWLPILVVLSLLCRFEAGLFIPLLAWLLWRERKAPKLIAFLPAIALVLLYLLLNHHWYGAYLPNSATSKLGQARSGFWGHWPWSFFNVAWLLKKGGAFHGTAFLIPPVLVLCVFGWDKMRRNRFGQLITPFILALFAFYVLFNIPAYHWYYAPIVFMVILYAVYGMPQNKVGHVIVACCVLICLVQASLYLPRLTLVMDYVNVSQWINANTPPDATVEAAEIGTIGWYTHRKVIDILGLTDPKNAVHIEHGDVTSWLREDHPDYIVVHHPLWAWERVTEGDPHYRDAPYHSGNIYILERIKPASAQ
jgi:hypothetical protein